MTTEEGNKIIAVWMGARVKDRNYSHLWKAIFNDDSRKCNDYDREDRRVYFAAQLKYHSSWDYWLMPAIKKWDSLDFTDSEIMLEYASLCDEMDESVTRNYDISEAFEQFVKCIEWHNKQK